MHEELIKNIRSIKQRLGIGVITTLNGTDHHLMNQLDRMEELVNKNFALADVSKSVCDDCTAYPFDDRGKTPLCKTCKDNPSQTVL